MSLPGRLPFLQESVHGKAINGEDMDKLHVENK